MNSKPFDSSEYGRRALAHQARALDVLAQRLDDRFRQAVELFASCRGAVIVSGIGKSGWVGQRISATFAVAGTRSFFLHPSEAMHGDLGRLGADDVALIVSYSGATYEILNLARQLNQLNLPIVALTETQMSPLGRLSALTIEIGSIEESCPFGLMPTTSATTTAALGDALATAVSGVRGFTQDQFEKVHPGGVLGLEFCRGRTKADRPAESRQL